MRAFWLWSVIGGGGCGWLYYLGEAYVLHGFATDSWNPLIRCLAVWTVLGIVSLVVILRCSRNADSNIGGMAAFALVGLPTVLSSFWLLWLLQ